MNLQEVFAQFTAFDVAGLVVLAIFALRAAIKGFIREFMGVATVLVGFLGGWLFSGTLSPLVGRWLGEGPWNQLVAFLIIFLACFLLMMLFRGALRSIVEGFHLEILDHVLGFALGIVEGLVVVFVLVFVASLIPLDSVQEALGRSAVYSLMSPFIAQADQAVQSGLRGLPVPELPAMPEAK